MNIHPDIAARTIEISRLIDAPRALVFQMFADPKHLDAWWGPNGFRNETHTMKFEDFGENETLLSEVVDYRVPWGIVGLLADDLLIRSEFTKILKRRARDATKHFTADASQHFSTPLGDL